MPDPIDIHVGRRIRTRRLLLEMTQKALAAHLGLTFQQIQKYERGANRVGASRLYEIAKKLKVHAGFFFDGIDPPKEGVRELAEPDENQPPNALSAAETALLIRAYGRILDPKQRRLLLDLAETFAAQTRPPSL